MHATHGQLMTLATYGSATWRSRNDATFTPRVKLTRDAVLLNKTDDFMVADRSNEGFIH